MAIRNGTLDRRRSPKSASLAEFVFCQSIYDLMKKSRMFMDAAVMKTKYILSNMSRAKTIVIQNRCYWLYNGVMKKAIAEINSPSELNQSIHTTFDKTYKQIFAEMKSGGCRIDGKFAEQVALA